MNDDSVMPRGGRKGKLLSLKLFLVVLPLLALSLMSTLLMANDPMRYFKIGYPCYRQNKQFAQSHDGYYRVLICGDSTAKTGWLPALLTEDTYNYALGGVSPVEEYYYILDYLQNNQAPEYIIYGMSLGHFLEASSFWSESVYYHTLDLDSLLDVYANKPDFAESGVWGDKGWLDIALYYSYSPVYYSSAVLKGLIHDRTPANQQIYDEVIGNDGQILYGQSQAIEERVNDIVKQRAFIPDALVDHYFRKTIDLCAEYGIKFIFQSLPVTASTYERLDKEFLAQYDAYMEQIREAYPDIVVNAQIQPCADDLFADQSHLNAKGVEQFTQQMRDKYRDIFEMG